MKAERILAAALCLALSVGLSACGNSRESQSSTAPSQTSLTSSSPQQTTTAQTTTTTSQTTTTTAQTTTPPIPTDKVSKQLFDSLVDGVTSQVQNNKIIQTGTLRGTTFTLTIDLTKWAKKTSVEQITVLSKLFWQCYPKMYSRFADLSSPPKSVTLAIENSGYEVAEASGDFIHLNDNWLAENPTDYDCITHELAHVIQAGWNSDYLEYSDYIERFADCCRYEYAFDNGLYNDAVWTLQTVRDEPTRESSVRFLVWLDATCSTDSYDFLRSYFKTCKSGNYYTADWSAAWSAILKGTPYENMTIEQVWAKYAASDFATLYSMSESGTPSELLQKYNIRSKADSLAAR